MPISVKADAINALPLPLSVRLAESEPFWPVYNINVAYGFFLVEIFRSLNFVSYEEIQDIEDGNGVIYPFCDFVEIT